MKLFGSILTFIVSLLIGDIIAVSAQSTHGIIQSPPNGTKVAPGSWVPFEYESMADYSVTSWNFTVWIYTSDPKVGLFSGDTTGVYVGTYSFNGPTNTDPANPPPPANIFIPNFSMSTGFGGGMPEINQTIFLAVYEEYSTGYSFGSKIAYTNNYLIYNCTTD